MGTSKINIRVDRDDGTYTEVSETIVPTEIADKMLCDAANNMMIVKKLPKPRQPKYNPLAMNNPTIAAKYKKGMKAYEERLRLYLEQPTYG